MWTGDRWEHGSEFHWPTYEVARSVVQPWGSAARLVGSGRDALALLVEYGRAIRGWRRLWVPSYYCPEVISNVLSTGIQCALYSDAPGEDNATELPGPRPGDVLLRVAYFGLGLGPTCRRILPPEIEVIEDHTHDPWSQCSRGSAAEWCFASLRKTLPLPDGGVLWSPQGLDLPSVVGSTELRELASLRKQCAMLLKAMYLAGHAVDKDLYRRISIAAEEHIADGCPSGMTDWSTHLLSTFPIEEWREQRKRNFWALSAVLADDQRVELMRPRSPDMACPFSGTLVFQSAGVRAEIRKRLISKNIYPAILWQLDTSVLAGIPARHIDLSRRILSVHCDARYGPERMRTVADAILAALDECSHLAQ